MDMGALEVGYSIGLCGPKSGVAGQAQLREEGSREYTHASSFSVLWTSEVRGTACIYSSLLDRSTAHAPPHVPVPLLLLLQY